MELLRVTEQLRREAFALLLVCFSGIALAQDFPGAVPARQMPRAHDATFLDIAFAGDRVVAVGERGIVIYSDDGAQSWQQAQVPVDVTLTAVTFLDEQTGFAVGHQATILRTEDAGATWSLKHYDVESNKFYLDLQFFDGERGAILGSDGELWSTQDGGENWSLDVLAVEEWYQNHLFGIVELTEGGYLVAAEKGVLYRIDREGNWRSVESPYHGSYFGVLKTAAGDLLLYGMSGRVFRSADGGDSWQEVDSGTEEFLLDGVQLADGRIVLAGLGGVVVVIDPESWQALPRIGRNRVGITAIAPREGYLYIARQSGGVTRTTVADLLG